MKVLLNLCSGKLPMQYIRHLLLMAYVTGLANKISNNVVFRLDQKFGEKVPSIEDIQDLVIIILEIRGHKVVSK